MTPRKPAFSSRVAISAARTCSGVSNAGTQARNVLGQAYLGAGARLGADRLHGEPVRQHDVMRAWFSSPNGSFRPGASMPQP